MNSDQLLKTVNSFWDHHITPILTEYIKIPNKSPSFDPNWEKNGFMKEVLDLAVDWTNKHKPKKSKLYVIGGGILQDIGGFISVTTACNITMNYV